MKFYKLNIEVVEVDLRPIFKWVNIILWPFNVLIWTYIILSGRWPF